MNYNLIRSILKTIPTLGYLNAYSVVDDETFGDYLLALASEVRSLRAEDLQRRLDYAEAERNDYRQEVSRLRERVAQLEFAQRFPGKSIEEIADQVWAETPSPTGGIIPAIKEFRAVTGLTLRGSKNFIEAARDRALAS